MTKNITIATRASKLALWQSEHIAARLRDLYPNMTITLLPMSTKGDEILDRSPSKIGGKGLFIKELENALLDGRADLAVHSLKDVPVDLDDRFQLAAISEREDPRDALVGCSDLSMLGAGSVVGTSSLRRAAQILRHHPSLRIESLRGNLDTRLSKLDTGHYQAIILAASGLKRLGYTHRIAATIDPNVMIPAAGQGALGIECLQTRSDIATLLAPLACQSTTNAVLAERAVAVALGASCSTPLAAHAVLDSNARLCLNVWAGSADGKQHCGGAYLQQVDETPTKLGQRAAQGLISQGALQLIAA